MTVFTVQVHVVILSYFRVVGPCAHFDGLQQTDMVNLNSEQQWKLVIFSGYVNVDEL